MIEVLLPWACALILPATVATEPSQDLVRYDQEFGTHWFDGRAEVACYELRRERYGRSRDGRLVAITVTEPWSESRRVKADGAGEDGFGVLKLNWMQSFRTGIYDYTTMSSAFVATEDWGQGRAGTPVKLSFTSQEWCGTMFHAADFDADAVRMEQRAYFEGEERADESLPRPEGALCEDSLMLWARGLAGPVVEPGDALRRPVLTSLERARLDHLPVEWLPCTLSRSSETSTIEVPAGRFRVREAKALPSEEVHAPTWTFQVEAEFPHRVVAMSRSDGWSATLTGVERLRYWTMTGPKGEEVLRRLQGGARPAEDGGDEAPR